MNPFLNIDFNCCGCIIIFITLKAHWLIMGLYGGRSHFIYPQVSVLKVFKSSQAAFIMMKQSFFWSPEPTVAAWVFVWPGLLRVSTDQFHLLLQRFGVVFFPP